MPRPQRRPSQAVITIDVDCMHGHTVKLRVGRRQRGREDRCIDLSYQRWLPRYLDLLAESGLCSTFFLVADFARQPGNRPFLQRLVAAGHEVASHSLTHRLELCSLPLADKAREIRDSKKILEDLSGQEVVGFRGPGYAFDADIARLLVENGYLYDSSVVPGYLFPLYKRVRRWYDRLVSVQATVHPNAPPIVARAPYFIPTGNGGRLAELPLNVLPLVPYPLISHVLTSEKKFRLLYLLLHQRAPLIVHALHDFEFMDCNHPEEYVQSQAVDTVACQDLATRLAMQR
ncbi:MAG: polysaccharide deacetylase family protein [Desulfobacca sp.]|uniref:polysaccharide deacetylase family protein n=1 Tax=Desulfobacca sp. TaxID=2067990 RepID=UPI00404AF6DB